jgi:hypothetical protein
VSELEAKEAYIVVLAIREGRRKAFRYQLEVPLAFARGHYQKLSDRALNDIIKDLRHEQCRREGAS